MRLINSEAIATTLPYPLKSGYIGLLTVQPEQEGEFQPIQLPELSEGPHFWYAVQWFLFAGIALLIYVLALRLRERDRAKADG